MKIKTPECKEIEKYDEEQYNELLDCDGTVSVAGMEFYPSDILKACDPIAYRVGMSDCQEYVDCYICPICDTEFNDDEYADAEEEAKVCCQDVNACDECGEEYDNEEEAIQCCNEGGDDV